MPAILYDNYGEPINEILNPNYTPIANEPNISISPSSFIDPYSDISPFASGFAVKGKADVVFVIDTTGSMSGAIANVRNNISIFAEKLVNEHNVDANFALVEYRDITVDGVNSTRTHKSGISNWFTDVSALKAKLNTLSVTGGGDEPETAIDGLEMARRLDFRTNADKFVILVTDASNKNNNNYGITNMTEMTNLFVNDGVNVSVICHQESLYADLIKRTSGLYGYIYGNFSSILLGLADKIGSVTNSGEWILLDDYQAIKLAAPLSTNKDTDVDGLSDRSELKNQYAKDVTDLVNALLISHSTPRNLYAGKTQITVWSYYSNPVLLDTDYDGVPDGYKDYDGKTVAADESPRDNSFVGKLSYEVDGNTKESKQNVEFVVDYRLLFNNNTLYQKDLAVLTSLYAADIYSKTYLMVTGGINGGNDNPKTLGAMFGLKDVEDIKIDGASYGVDEDDSTEFTIGHRSITYKGITKDIIVVVVRGTNGTNAEWSSNFDVGADSSDYYSATGSHHPDWRNKKNHKGFDVAANRILAKVDDYLIRNSLTSSNSKTILVTGHSRGAAIANLLGAHFEKSSGYTSFTYTFAAPNPTTDSNAGSYRSIFNIVNKDDIIPYLPLSSWGFSKYGVTRDISVQNHYENHWGGAQKGTWEWLVGTEYNNDGGTQRTLNAFAKIASNRNDLYALDTSSDGTVWENNVGDITRSGAEKELAELTKTLEDEKLLKFCRLEVVGGGISYHVEVNYCPAYLMQSLSNMTTGVGPALGHDVKGKYKDAKVSFVASSGKLAVGGMTHPHLPITYYLIAYNNFVNKV